jgi:hypothetical protein
MAAWIQGDIEGDYSKREYRKNILVVGDRGNGSGDAFQGDDVTFKARCDDVTGKIREDLGEGRKE